MDIFQEYAEKEKMPDRAFVHALVDRMFDNSSFEPKGIVIYASGEDKSSCYQYGHLGPGDVSTIIEEMLKSY